MIWIFAYGSLIWRPGFNHEKCVQASVQGYERRFCQASHDHRGTPESPGRVVTLVRSINRCCDGLVYGLSAHEQDAILQLLDEREQDGYQRTWLKAKLDGGEEVSALTWVAKPDNPSWRGGESIELVASLIADRHGPSGSNREYLFKLDSALRELALRDDYVSNLTELVKAQPVSSQESSVGKLSR